MICKNIGLRILNFSYTSFFLIVIFFCSACNKKRADETTSYEDDISSLAEFLKSEEIECFPIEFESLLRAPLPIASNDSSIILFDFGDSRIKQLYSNGNSTEFNPFDDGPTRIEGSYLKSAGYTQDPRILLVGTGSQIKKYNTVTNMYEEEEIDSFEDCFSFSAVYSEIFYIPFKGDTLIVSQNGKPCFSPNSSNEVVSVEDFKNVNFLSIKTKSTDNPNFSPKFPSESDIVEEDKLYLKTRFLLSFNEMTNSFFAMINPSNQLFEYILTDSKELELKKVVSLSLPFFGQPIDYSYANPDHLSIADDNLLYNSELKSIHTAGDYLIISYRPSKSLEYNDVSKAPYSSGYLLSIVDLKNGKMRIFSLNFDEFIYLGTTNNGDIWLYDVPNSEQGSSTKIKMINAKEVFKN